MLFNKKKICTKVYCQNSKSLPIIVPSLGSTLVVLRQSVGQSGQSRLYIIYNMYICILLLSMYCMGT